MPSFTNRWINSEFSGAAVGVIGSGGAAPSLWDFPTTGGGQTVTNEIMSIGTVSGKTVLRWKITYANATGGDAYPGIYFGYIPNILGSTQYQWSVWLRNVSFTGTSYFEWLGTNQLTAGYGFVEQNNGLYNTTSTLTQATGSRTTHADTRIIQPYLGWGLPTGNNFVSEIEIAQGQWIDGASLPPSYIPTTSATPVTQSFGGGVTPPPNRPFLHNLLR